MKKYQSFSIGLLCILATSVSAQISTLPAGFESNVSRPDRTEVAEPPYIGIVDVRPEQLTSEEQCRRFESEVFYRIGECSELKIVNNQLQLVPLSDSKYVFRGTIVVPEKIRNGYFGTDSLLLNDTEEHAILKAKLQAEGADECEDLQYLKRGYEYLLKDSIEIVEEYEREVEACNKSIVGLNPNKGLFKKEHARQIEKVKSFCEELRSNCQQKLAAGAHNRTKSRNRIEQVRFMKNYYANRIMGNGTISHHPYGRKFVILQDSVGGIHYVQSSLVKDQFVATKYYDRIRREFAGQNVCIVYDGTSSVTDAYSGERVPIETSYFNADTSKSRKHLYLCKDIVVYGKQPTLCAVIEKGENRFLASIRRHMHNIDEEKFIYKYGVELQDKQTLLLESAFDVEEQRLIRNKQAKMQANENARKAAAAKEKAATEARKAELIRRFGVENGSKIERGQVALGMSKAMCREAWGSPTYRQQAKNLVGTSEIWYYTRTDRRLVFTNDKLVEILDRQR